MSRPPVPACAAQWQWSGPGHTVVGASQGGVWAGCGTVAVPTTTNYGSRRAAADFPGHKYNVLPQTSNEKELTSEQIATAEAPAAVTHRQPCAQACRQAAGGKSPAQCGAVGGACCSSELDPTASCPTGALVPGAPVSPAAPWPAAAAGRCRPGTPRARQVPPVERGGV